MLLKLSKYLTTEVCTINTVAFQRDELLTNIAYDDELTVSVFLD